MPAPDLARRAVAEALGTAGLLAAVVGSGIMAERLAGGSAALALLGNSLATGAALGAILLALAPVSGGHLNPLVTLALAWQRGIAWRDVPTYVAAQLAGAAAGVALAHAMFEEPLALSRRARAGPGQILAEVVATFGLVLVALAVARRRAAAVPLAVGAYVVAAYWFTSSTAFANPAVALARTLTDTFTGIRPRDALPFVAAEVVGAALAAALVAWMIPAGTVEPDRRGAA
jgi:glycerol uptake facilitator-like aquaporin